MKIVEFVNNACQNVKHAQPKVFVILVTKNVTNVNLNAKLVKKKINVKLVKKKINMKLVNRLSKPRKEKV
jgi:hypothetical protein